jgi:uncharacterized protein (TIGR03086 family)
MLELLEGAFTSTGAQMAKLTPADLDPSTPCPKWAVRDLVNHTTSVVARFGAAASRSESPFGPDHDFVGDDPGATFDQTAAATLQAWSETGAFEGTVKLGSGAELPARAAANINFLDTLIHGWDLAKALGDDPTIDPALATAAYDVARQVLKDRPRGPDQAFMPAIPVPADAPPTDRLVAFLGRQP